MLFPSILLFILGSVEAISEEYTSNYNLIGLNSNFGDTKYRLDDTVYPLLMTLDLDVYLDESRFRGFLKMDIEVSSLLDCFYTL